MRFRHAGAAAFVVALAFSSSAFAHAVLMESTPKIAGQAPAGMQAVTLRYNSLIDVERSRLVLIGPDGATQVVPITGGGNGDTIHAGIVLQPGHQLLRWQVLAVDGHITRGDVPFDVTATGH